LPGNEASLNKEQIKQAFYDAMPSAWRERYIQAGHSSVIFASKNILLFKNNLRIKLLNVLNPKRVIPNTGLLQEAQ
jgi:hypothetical protein